jgi:hypothetical protein
VGRLLNRLMVNRRQVKFEGVQEFIGIQIVLHLGGRSVAIVDAITMICDT